MPMVAVADDVEIFYRACADSESHRQEPERIRAR